MDRKWKAVRNKFKGTNVFDIETDKKTFVGEGFGEDNARLFAAAPDMLKALKAQDIAEANDRGEDIYPAMRELGEVDLYESGDDLHEWANELRRVAIAKARGES